MKEFYSLHDRNRRFTSVCLTGCYAGNQITKGVSKYYVFICYFCFLLIFQKSSYLSTVIEQYQYKTYSTKMRISYVGHRSSLCLVDLHMMMLTMICYMWVWCRLYFCLLLWILLGAWWKWTINIELKELIWVSDQVLYSECFFVLFCFVNSLQLQNYYYQPYPFLTMQSKINFLTCIKLFNTDSEPIRNTEMA